VRAKREAKRGGLLQEFAKEHGGKIRGLGESENETPPQSRTDERPSW